MAQIINGHNQKLLQTINNGGATYDISSVYDTTNPDAIFEGPGTYTLNVLNAYNETYTLTAAKGAHLVINGTSESNSTTNLVIDGASSISLYTQVSDGSAINVQFNGPGGTLILPPSQSSIGSTPAVVSGFGPGDQIDFGSPLTSGDKIVYDSTTGTLAMVGPHGAILGAVTLIGSYTKADFVLAPGPNGTMGIDFACFLAGTKILTPSGEVAVELLQAGDEVMTLTNGAVAIKAVRLRSFSAEAEIASPKLRPVCISAGALEENVPHRDLYVSPDHSMFLNGALVPAQLLVNGSTITQPAHAGAVNYYHVEIEPHDILIAEGAASESYLDIGNRSHFGKAGVVSLFPATEPKTWEDACAPLLLAGPKLARIQASIAARAEMLVPGSELAQVA